MKKQIALAIFLLAASPLLAMDEEGKSGKNAFEQQEEKSSEQVFSMSGVAYFLEDGTLLFVDLVSLRYFLQLERIRAAMDELAVETEGKEQDDKQAEDDEKNGDAEVAKLKKQLAEDEEFARQLQEKEEEFSNR